MGIGRAIEDWNYGNDPANSQVDRVRKLIGDTDPNSKFVSDSEIEYNITLSADDYEAAWRSACDIMAWTARLVSKSGGGMTEAAADAHKHYKALAEHLLALAPMAIPKAPQLRHADRDRMEGDSTLIQPQFGVGMLSEDAEAIRPNTNRVTPPDEAL